LKRFWLILIAFAVIVTGWIVMSIASSPREPSYKGRTLSQWLEPDAADISGYARESYKTPERIQAEEAMRAIGTNAIPTMLAWLKVKDSRTPPIRIVVMNWIDKIRGRPAGIYRTADWKPFLAMHGFELLGTNAQSAVPALIQLGYDTNFEPDFAYLCLNRLDTNAANRMMSYRISLEEKAKHLSATNSPPAK
jgi:hypothetical protein